MDVNFTGLSNIYGIKLKLDMVNESYKRIGKSESNHLAMMLNDEGGHDLTEFRKMITTTDKPIPLNPVFDEFVVVSSHKMNFVDDMGVKHSITEFLVNNDEPLKINDKNLKFYTYLAKLLNKVQSIPDDKFMVSNAFIRTDFVNKILSVNKELPFDLRQFVPSIFLPTNVKAQAKNIGDNLQNSMIKYFG